MSAQTPAVVTVGSVHLDLVATADRLPVRGETLPGRTFAMHPGGKGGNQATQVARCGVASAMVGRVGADPFGERLRAALAAKGVNTTHLTVDPDAPTGASTVLVGEGGDYASVIVPGAAARLDEADLAAARPAFAAASVLLLQLEIPLAVSAAAAAMARDLGARVVLSAAPAPPDPAALRAAFPDGPDVLIANTVEAGMLVGAPVGTPREAAGAARELRGRFGAGVVLVTLGPGGVLALAPDGEHHLPGWPVDVVETIGGGDAFAGALAAELARGAELLPAVGYANAAGALAVTRPGAHDALPTGEEIRVFLATRLSGDEDR